MDSRSAHAALLMMSLFLAGDAGVLMKCFNLTVSESSTGVLESNAPTPVGTEGRQSSSFFSSAIPEGNQVQMASAPSLLGLMSLSTTQRLNPSPTFSFPFLHPTKGNFSKELVDHLTSVAAEIKTSEQFSSHVVLFSPSSTYLKISPGTTKSPECRCPEAADPKGRKKRELKMIRMTVSSDLDLTICNPGDPGCLSTTEKTPDKGQSSAESVLSTGAVVGICFGIVLFILGVLFCFCGVKTCGKYRRLVPQRGTKTLFPESCFPIGRVEGSNGNFLGMVLFDREMVKSLKTQFKGNFRPGKEVEDEGDSFIMTILMESTNACCGFITTSGEDIPLITSTVLTRVKSSERLKYLKVHGEQLIRILQRGLEGNHRTGRQVVGDLMEHLSSHFGDKVDGIFEENALYAETRSFMHGSSAAPAHSVVGFILQLGGQASLVLTKGVLFKFKGGVNFPWLGANPDACSSSETASARDFPIRGEDIAMSVLDRSDPEGDLRNDFY